MKTKLIITGIVLMVIGMVLMYFTKNSLFSIVYFIGLLLSGVSIVISLAQRRKDK